MEKRRGLWLGLLIGTPLGAVGAWVVKHFLGEDIRERWAMHLKNARDAGRASAKQHQHEMEAELAERRGIND